MSFDNIITGYERKAAHARFWFILHVVTAGACVLMGAAAGEWYFAVLFGIPGGLNVFLAVMQWGNWRNNVRMARAAARVREALSEMP